MPSRNPPTRPAVVPAPEPTSVAVPAAPAPAAQGPLRGRAISIIPKPDGRYEVLVFECDYNSPDLRVGEVVRRETAASRTVALGLFMSLAGAAVRDAVI